MHAFRLLFSPVGAMQRGHFESKLLKTAKEALARIQENLDDADIEVGEIAQ
jgi:hypothetical protein